ncbi:hypothetical protein SAMN05421736_1395 [Evansella caseinilytica]|uniref:Uncharacterized protein n=1 Tax=Evansella caseinilytica TaxID=1503961 RepID=A0A1H3V2D8_9BACI|nr:hypothetical protein [Evansella caseinilytica]SDZ68767.1 hypothetical protein SAMN05421736_1395 [Evansella caseinilytica]
MDNLRETYQILVRMHSIENEYAQLSQEETPKDIFRVRTVFILLTVGFSLYFIYGWLSSLLSSYATYGATVFDKIMTTIGMSIVLFLATGWIGLTE